MLYLLHGCKGCKKIARGALPQIFHSAIFSMDDEIYWKEYVPRVLNPWLMQYHSIFRNIRLFHQSTARTILGRPISAHMIDVNQPVVPVVKLVFCGLWDGDKNKSMTCAWPARVILSGRKFVARNRRSEGTIAGILGKATSGIHEKCPFSTRPRSSFFWSSPGAHHSSRRPLLS